MADMEENVSRVGWYLLVFAVGAVLIANVAMDINDDCIRKLSLQQYETVQKRHCVEGEARFLVQMPDQTRQWVRGKTPIPCKEK